MQGLGGDYVKAEFDNAMIKYGLVVCLLRGIFIT